MHLTVDEACARLGVHRNTIGRMRRDGRLDSIKITVVPQGRVLITETSLEALEKRKVAELGKAAS